MSAFFVAAATIDATVSAFIAQEGPLSLEAATRLGRELWALNAEAVRWCYDLDTGTEEQLAEHAASLAATAAYAWTPRELTEAVMVKALDCLAYQCCEGPIRDTALYRRLIDLSNRYDAGGVRETPEYDRAPWRLDDARLMGGVPTRAPIELTPEGEQFVIPGCERNRSALLRQLDLFG